MSETKMYYLGIGEKFIKAQCKPYKTIEGALCVKQIPVPVSSHTCATVIGSNIWA